MTASSTVRASAAISRRRCAGRFIVPILATALRGQDAPVGPPPDLVKRLAQRELLTEQARNEYTYRQTLTVDELSSGGASQGRFREVRDIVFTPEGARTEKVLEAGVPSFKRLRLTEQDFEDLRNIQPLLLEPGKSARYDFKPKGDQVMDEIDCWVLQVKPRQILMGQRFFDGLIYVDKRDYSIIRLEGQAVPQVYTRKGNVREENLFPHFTTIRRPVDNKWWFPAQTYADDVLPFASGGLRIRMVVRYADYQRFSVESKIVP